MGEIKKIKSTGLERNLQAQDKLQGLKTKLSQLETQGEPGMLMQSFAQYVASKNDNDFQQVGSANRVKEATNKKGENKMRSHLSSLQDLLKEHQNVQVHSKGSKGNSDLTQKSIPPMIAKPDAPIRTVSHKGFQTEQHDMYNSNIEREGKHFEL